MPPTDDPFAVQSDVRAPWRRYLDALEPLRGDLHRYCCALTGNIWDGEDLVQDTLVRVFSLLGKIDADLTQPRVPDSYCQQPVDRSYAARRARAPRARVAAAEGAWGFGVDPNWRVVEYTGEPLVLGFRTLDGCDGLNEAHRLEVRDDRIVRIRCYCFCPDTLHALGAELGLPALKRRYRSPP